MYVYPLPSELDVQGPQLREAGRGGWGTRGVFEASRVFLEQLHSRRHLVADPSEAQLFFVPVLLSQTHGNLWEPMAFLASVVHYLAHRFPCELSGFDSIRNTYSNAHLHDSARVDSFTKAT